MIENGCKFIGLYQDPRMGGRKYWEELISTIKNAKLDFERLSLDMLVPSSEEFIKAVASLGQNTIIHICPDTGSNEVRRKLGRYYSSDQLLNTVKTCHKYHIPVTTFFSAGLAGENSENIGETWKLWEQLTELDIDAIKNKSFGSQDSGVPVGGPIIGPIVLDPGSQAFDNPEKYGYKLLYKNLEEYVKALSQPGWHQWLNYETDLLDKEQILELIFSSNDFAIEQRQRMGLYDGAAAESEHLRLEAERITVAEVNKILSHKNEKKHQKKLKDLRTYLDNFLSATHPQNMVDEF